MTDLIPIRRELLKRALKADASIGATSIELVDGWKAMAELRYMLAEDADAPAELTNVRCHCAREYPHDSYDAGFIAGSGMCQVCDAAIPAVDLPSAAPAEQPYPHGIAEDLERSDWAPLEALQWYAAGKHFDVADGRTRIIDTGAVASNALKHASLAYLELKGDAELSELRAALSAQKSAPERGDGWIPVNERLPSMVQEVIVNSEFDGVTAGILDSYGEWYSPNSDYKLTRVVAWQPLPAAPSLLATHRGQASGCHSEGDQNE